MDKLGYDSTFRNNSCRITKGTLIVEKGKSYRIIYYLYGNMVINDVATTISGNI